MNASHLTIKIYSHHFSATRLSARGRWICNNFAKNYVAYGWQNDRGQYRKVALKVYAAATDDREEFRFHKHQLDKFKEFMLNNNVTGDLVEWVNVPEAIGCPTVFEVRPQWVARDYQIPVIEYLAQKDPTSKFVDLQTGKGKSLVSMLAISAFAKRLVIIIKPMYIEKWVDDLNKTYDIDPLDIIVVRGSSQLMALLLLAKAGQITEKAIIISNKTFQNWISAYEKYHNETLDMGYACLPYEFFGVVNAGIRLIDELHQDWHLNFKIDLYTHIEQSISLSATLISNDPFIDSMYELAYPKNDRFMGLALDKYIDSYAIHYLFRTPDKIRTEEHGGRGYSHGALEKSVMRHVPTLHNYYNLIDYVLQIGYFACKRKKKKVLIFAASIDLCTLLTNHFKQRYPHLDIRRYVGDDDYSNLMEFKDICFSTLGSSGTAVDIPDLTNVILTVGVSSIKSNVQSLGRLRKLEEGSPVEFHYFCCDSVPKHLEYHENKKEMLSKRAKSFRDIFSGQIV